MKRIFKVFILAFVFCNVFFEGKISANDLVDNEPIDVVIKYIDLTDENLKREGILRLRRITIMKN